MPVSVLDGHLSHTRYGPTTIFPTTTGSPKQLSAMMEACTEVRRANRAENGAQIGCHSREGCRPPSPRAGVWHVDHFWCTMGSVTSLRVRFGTPVRAGMEQYLLSNEAMSMEVIAYGCHLSPELLEFARRMIGPHRLCLVTDA